MSFGEKLRRLRQKHELSQAALAADITGMSLGITMTQAYVSSLEKRPDAPRGELLEAFGYYFGVPPSYFLVSDEDSGMHNNRLGIAEFWLDYITEHGEPPRPDTSGDDAIASEIKRLHFNAF